MRDLSICSAIGQPASSTESSTRFSGERILTVSAMNRTPHISIVPACAFAACTLSWKESPTKSATSKISCA